MPRYDYIFLGAGAATLSLVLRMIHSQKFSDKKILIIEKSAKKSNDRTWCFWENKQGFFEELVHRKWGQLDFYSKDFSSPLDIHPYQYKMIRGIDFYNYSFAQISQQSNIEIIYGSASIEAETIMVDGNTIDTTQSTVFNSIYHPITKGSSEYIQLLQHFKGWIIETANDKFDPNRATLMDFRVHQRYGTSFVYVLPLTRNTALIEYTQFTASVLKQEQYQEELNNYISGFLGLKNFTIKEEEFGIIPMTTAPFSFHGNGYFNIGTAGGQTKASTGYTFQYIQKQSDEILECLLQGRSLKTITDQPNRFLFYDKVLLQLLHEGKLPGDQIFSRLFSRNKAQAIFKFLDNETSLGEELRLIKSLQIFPFLKAAIKMSRNLVG